MPTGLAIGVSSCLLGHPVRYDGGHKRHDFVIDVLARVARLVPVCPEVELGLGTPRPTLQLRRGTLGLRLVMETGEDLTDRMRAYAATRVASLEAEDLDGYLLKARSPSCGLDDVPVVDEGQAAPAADRGLFAAALVARHPHLPVVDEAGVATSAGQLHFLNRVRSYRRLKELFRSDWTVDELVRFHTAHTLALLSASERITRRLGRLVAGSAAKPRAAVERDYTADFMAAMATAPPPGRASSS